MFNRKLRKHVESLERQLGFLEEEVRGNKHYSVRNELLELREDFARLLNYLGLQRVVTHGVTLKRKDG